MENAVKLVLAMKENWNDRVRSYVNDCYDSNESLFIKHPIKMSIVMWPEGNDMLHQCTISIPSTFLYIDHTDFS
jgi:hypothetical protein